MNLRIPGPTPLPPQVIAAMQRPMINHRSAEFAELHHRIIAGLRPLFETSDDILLLPGSGTGGLEAALVNVLSPGDHVLACIAGEFGRRFAQIAATFGARVEELVFPPGTAVDPARVVERLRADSAICAVLLTHNETSTGVLHPLQLLAATVREHSSALVLVDAVSSLGATRVATDDWALDVVITCSQKALMAPPGAAALAIGKRGWDAYARARTPRYFWDWKEWKKYGDKGQTPVTPPVSIYYALDAALSLIHEEGLANVFARHLHLASWTRRQAVELGYSLFADQSYTSPTVTALRPPIGPSANTLIRRMRADMHVDVAGGQGELADKIIRIGHMGYIHEPEIQDLLWALEGVLIEPAVEVVG